MRVHELIKILQKMEPDAEIMVGSHTLKHNNSNHGKCSDPIGTWPAMAVEVGVFTQGGPFDQDHWVTIVASDVWGCTFVDSQGISRRTPVKAFKTVRGVPADIVNDPEWADRHLRSCGTAFRGCDPECPKELAERLRNPTRDREDGL
jgi:hypothetical protein